MKIDILTLFPKIFETPFSESIIKRAKEKGLVKIDIHNLRNWTKDSHKTVDDRPYGGSTGMILMVEPIDEALKDIRQKNLKKQRVVLLSPRGKVFNQKKALEYSKLNQLILICGHYEGVDERVSQYLVDEEVSIGDYVLTGGEIPTMVVVDCVTRLIPGVLKKPEATKFESFSALSKQNLPLTANRLQLLEYPQYTRPENYRSWKVPRILLSGDHQKIEKWRLEKSLQITRHKRPELLKV